MFQDTPAALSNPFAVLNVGTNGGGTGAGGITARTAGLPPNSCWKLARGESVAVEAFAGADEAFAGAEEAGGRPNSCWKSDWTAGFRLSVCPMGADEAGRLPNSC